MPWYTLSRGWIGWLYAYLFERIGVDKNPANFDDLCGILGHVDTVFVAGGGNVDNDITVRVELIKRLRRHIGRCGEAVSRKAQLQLVRKLLLLLLLNRTRLIRQLAMAARAIQTTQRSVSCQ